MNVNKLLSTNCEMIHVYMMIIENCSRDNVRNH